MEKRLLHLPGIKNDFYDPHSPHAIHKSLIFTFGSNEAGRHGKGAAKTAYERYGAIYYNAVGFRGRSYAVPTKDRFLVPLPLEAIEIYVRDFAEFTRTSGYIFYVTGIGTGYAGYRPDQIAPFFKDCQNCWLPFKWKQFISEGG